MINEKYSYKDFMDKTFLDVPVKEFNNTLIVGSCFYQQEEPNKKVFPEGMKGVTFVKCNLDNVYISKGNKIETGCHRKLKSQNDLSDWVLDDELNPIEPMDKKEREKLGLSIDPKDIPKNKMTEPLLHQKLKETLKEIK